MTSRRGSMTHSKRRSTVKGRMTEPYSDSEYGPRSVSATLHTKLDRADTIEISPGRRDRLARFFNTIGGVRHGQDCDMRTTVVATMFAAGLHLLREPSRLGSTVFIYT